MIARALLIVNAASAAGHSPGTIDRLRAAFEENLAHIPERQVRVVDSHSGAGEQTREFLTTNDAPALIISGGGGGTLSAVIEAICETSPPGPLPGPGHVRVAALRMGSGNVLAEHLQIPLDPTSALQSVGTQARADRTLPCCIMRCEIDAGSQVRHATTLGGLGQFGRIPRDLARWHRRLPRVHRHAAHLLGIERLTRIEYSLALFARTAWCALRPGTPETLRIRAGNRVEHIRLLSGAIVNFPFHGLPFDPGVRIHEPVLSLILVPFHERGSLRARIRSPRLQIRITESEPVEIQLAGRSSADFFLDENPLTFHRSLNIRVAGTLAFVPGSPRPQRGLPWPITSASWESTEAAKAPSPTPCPTCWPQKQT